MARGDRRLSAVIEAVWRNGSFLESWEERFRPELWRDCMQQAGLDPAFYANRRRDYEELLPWAHLDYGVTHAFLVRENRLAHGAETTPHCRRRCAGCGANRLLGRECF